MGESVAGAASAAYPPMDRVPLPALLSRCEAAFIAEFDQRLADTEFCSLSLAHSRNVLSHLGRGPRRASEIASVGHVSKQAISQQIAHLERSGYLESAPDPDDHRSRALTLTPMGVRAQKLVRRLFVEIEEEWAREIGADDFAGLRRALGALLDRAPGADGCAPVALGVAISAERGS